MKQDDLLQTIADLRRDNMELWTELMMLCDKVEILRWALANKKDRACELLRAIAANDEAVARATRELAS